MDNPNKQKLFELLDQHPEWQVLDLGGWEQPLMRADWVVDIRDFDAPGNQGVIGDGQRRRNGRSRWVQMDMCGHKLPFNDKAFDFVFCSNVLEDLRDPLWLCAEIQRVGKVGYIEVPRVGQELTGGVDCRNGQYLGYWHHRWIVKPQVDARGHLELWFLPKFSMVNMKSWPVKDSQRGFEPIYWKDQIYTHEILTENSEQYYKVINDFLGVIDGCT